MRPGARWHKQLRACEREPYCQKKELAPNPKSSAEEAISICNFNPVLRASRIQSGTVQSLGLG